mgnify:CR=1 FL=1
MWCSWKSHQILNLLFVKWLYGRLLLWLGFLRSHHGCLNLRWVNFNSRWDNWSFSLFFRFLFCNHDHDEVSFLDVVISHQPIIVSEYFAICNKFLGVFWKLMIYFELCLDISNLYFYKIYESSILTVAFSENSIGNLSFFNVLIVIFIFYFNLSK